jgi:ubiquinone/menaquinone biosynthesis C-methylase UbiE
VIGIDCSLAADVAASNFLEDFNVCICQADALKLPIKSGSIDGAYSIGVLHHTPSPMSGVKEAFRVLRPGGWFSMSVHA